MLAIGGLKTCICVSNGRKDHISATKLFIMKVVNARNAAKEERLICLMNLKPKQVLSSPKSRAAPRDMAFIQFELEK